MRPENLEAIDTLGTGTVTIDGKSFKGGLYPGGSNTPPPAHITALQATVEKIKPRKRNSVVFVGLGASNTAIEMQAFIQLAEASGKVSDDLELVNCCKGGISLSKINDIHGRYIYGYLPAQLQAAGFDAADPQVGWLKTDELELSTSTDFEKYLNIVVESYVQAVQNIKKALPNLKLLYLTSRNTTRYVSIPDLAKHEEPRAYFSQFVIKRLIELQMDGDPRLAYSGPDKKAPFLTWGPLFYSNGQVKNTFGHNWTTEDVKPTDHLHPSQIGAQKMANLLLNFFTTDQYAQVWFKNNN